MDVKSIKNTPYKFYNFYANSYNVIIVLCLSTKHMWQICLNARKWSFSAASYNKNSHNRAFTLIFSVFKISNFFVAPLMLFAKVHKNPTP